MNHQINRQTLAIIPVALLFLMTACQKNQPANKANSNAPTTTASSTPDEFASARGSFDKNCKVCHTNGEGGPVKLDDGTKIKVPSLREGHALQDALAGDWYYHVTIAYPDGKKIDMENDLARYIPSFELGGGGALLPCAGGTAHVALSMTSSYPTSDEKKRRCPICSKKMEKARLSREGKDIRILIDRCEKHHGTWLDGGELDAVVKLSSFPEAHKIHVFLRSIFGGDSRRAGS